MINQSFIFLDKVGLLSEKKIWNQDIKNWNDFLKAEEIQGMSKLNKKKNDYAIKKAKESLFHDDINFFSSNLPNQEIWRLYDTYKDEAIFLDIETSNTYGNITVIGMYDTVDTKMMIRGVNLDREIFLNEISKAKLIVTFNGGSFDLPVIKKFFRCEIDTPHIDLRGVCSRIGLTGGLKKIEQNLGISRPDHIRYVYGDDAAYLWHKFRKTGDEKYLNILIEYNEQDIINLKPLADYAISTLWKKIRN